MIHLFPAPRLRPARLLAAAALLALVVGGCGSEDTTRAASSVEDKVRVSGDFGEKPTITIAAPLKIPATKSWTQSKGTGGVVGPETTALLQLSLANARTGKTLISTTDPGQHPLEAKSTDQLFPSLLKGISGAKAGSRVVIASTAKDSYGTQGNPQLGLKAGDPVVMVADVLSTDPTSVLPGPSGATTPAPKTAPQIQEGAAGPTGFDVSGVRKPKQPQAYVLREGTGKPIDGAHRIAADYLGEVWGAKKPFDETYTKEPAKFSVGAGGVVPCWDKGLAGVKAGSRVLMVCPPASAYGKQAQPDIPANSTLVFVVDVLGVG